MINSQKLKGLYYLELFGLPIPKYQMVISLDDMSKLQLGASEFGWTIRTCLFTGLNENGLFVRNKISSQEVIETLNSRLQTYLNREFYLVYKSWSFIYSFNVYKKDNTYNYEGLKGSQQGISRGSGTPKIMFKIPFGFISQLDRSTEIPPDLESSYLPEINSLFRKVLWEEYSAEFAIIHDRSIIFYDLRNLEIPHP